MAYLQKPSNSFILFDGLKIIILRENNKCCTIKYIFIITRMKVIHMIYSYSTKYVKCIIYENSSKNVMYNCYCDRVLIKGMPFFIKEEITKILVKRIIRILNKMISCLFSVCKCDFGIFIIRKSYVLRISYNIINQSHKFIYII